MTRKSQWLFPSHWLLPWSPLVFVLVFTSNADESIPSNAKKSEKFEKLKNSTTVSLNHIITHRTCLSKDLSNYQHRFLIKIR